MSMAATKISRFFIIFTALLDKIAGYKAKETRTTTGRLTRPELTTFSPSQRRHNSHGYDTVRQSSKCLTQLRHGSNTKQSDSNWRVV
jgi:hypothetical protein